MSLSLSPPPLQLPGDFATDKVKNAFFTALLNTMYQIWTALYSIRTNHTSYTTDATVTALFNTIIDEGHTVMLDAQVVARRTGGVSGADGDSAFFKVTGAYKNIGGVLTGIGVPNTISGKDQAAWAVNFTSSGTTAIITVTGAAGNNITWAGNLSLYDVGA